MQSVIRLSGLVCVLVPAVAAAQFGDPPRLGNPYVRPAARLSSFPLPPPPPTIPPGYYPTPGAPVGFYPGYDWNYNGPVGGYFSGLADLTYAAGQYQKDYQSARLMNQEVERSRMDSRVKFLQLQQYERSLEPTAEQLIDQQRALALRRSMNDPPLPEITSGDALNILLKDISKKQITGGYSPTVPIDQSLLGQVNVAGGTGGNIALFKDGGNLRWPVALRDKGYNANREKFDELTQTALQQAKAGKLDPDTIRGMQESLDQIQSTIDKNAPNRSLTETIEAQKYADELRDAVQALRDPNVTHYFTKKWSPQGNDVAELVRNMTTQGLVFAPAVTGEESAYRALHHALVAYNTALSQQQAARRP